MILYTEFEEIQVERTNIGGTNMVAQPWGGGTKQSSKNGWVYLKIKSLAKRR